MQHDSPLDPPEASGEVDALARVEVTPKACMIVVTGKHPGRIFHLVGHETIIGRSPSAAIHLDDKAISSQHAKILAAADHYVLVDLGSTNGTFVNGERVPANQPVRLEFNDSVQVAETIFAFLPSKGGAPVEEQTQQLARLAPQLPASTLLRLPDAQAIAQLLQTSLLPAAPPEPPPPTFDEQIDKLLRLLAIAKRNWVPVFSAMALCALVGNVSAFIFPPRSEAAFTMRIMPSQDEDSQRNDPKNQRFYTAVEQNFSSPQLVQKSLDASPASGRPSLSDALGSLNFKSVAHMTYEATFTHPDPDFAVAFLSHHMKNFIDFQISRTLHVRQKELDFLTSRLKEREDELRRTEEALKNFKDKHLEGLPDYASGHITTRESLMAQRASLSAELARANAELALARKRLAEGAPLLARKVAAASPYEQSLVEVKRKLSEARAKGLGPDHPEIQALERQQRDLERLAAEARSKEATALEISADPELNALRARVGEMEVAVKGTSAALGEINAQLSRLDKIVGKMPEVEAEYAELTRSYGVNKEMHAKLFAQVRESQLKLELERTSALARYEVLEPPASSGVPLYKALLKRTGLGAGAGIALGVVIALLLEFRRLLQARAKRKAAAAAEVLTASHAIVQVSPSNPIDRAP